ncbi:glycosyl hydrolase family 28 protein [Halalkalibacterium halodurans]|uniref:glycosyl hydrolase family 28 protein n=1 Tax=Halalkalibacterium halodurans TaxID=86665 RepID=UPI002AA97FCC|nr:glycosyl hydrolase family 28 protein [Halalkalibacterium halodurans]MDY7223285.1 glycosyl hydrolase family 28 protein [Halalkalibacterium halodurans]MDY7242506.1 glycosyl hydrolase family 28 protein [Halalkalibacterium halodurans]
MSQLKVYSVPKEAVGNDDYSVKVRTKTGEWEDLFVYEVKVDMHHVRKASMVTFDMNEAVDIEVTCHYLNEINEVDIRPLSKNITSSQNGNTVLFSLDKPSKLSIEFNGERFRNLHLFANPIEVKKPDAEDTNVFLVEPGIHRPEDLLRAAEKPNSKDGTIPDIIYFRAGMHYIEQAILEIPSGKTVYLEGGSILVGSLICDSVENVTICGRGILYLSNFERFSSFRGVRILFSNNITIDGIMTIDPPHYSIYIGKSENIKISNFKSFSTRGWSDGINVMSSSNLDIEDVFLRTSDDCIAIYGSRWAYYGDARNITVRNSTFWADVAHPMNIGGHGDSQRNGDTIEDILFENIDILEHHEPQPGYWGAMAINAGDKNTVRNVTYKNIRVEHFELGQLFDLRVVWNEKYNPEPGSNISNIRFENIDYRGITENPSRIFGFDNERTVDGVIFKNLSINGRVATNLEEANIITNEFTKNVKFIG